MTIIEPVNSISRNVSINLSQPTPPPSLPKTITVSAFNKKTHFRSIQKPIPDNERAESQVRNESELLSWKDLDEEDLMLSVEVRLLYTSIQNRLDSLFL